MGETQKIAVGDIVVDMFSSDALQSLMEDIYSMHGIKASNKNETTTVSVYVVKEIIHEGGRTFYVVEDLVDKTKTCKDVQFYKLATPHQIVEAKMRANNEI